MGELTQETDLVVIGAGPGGYAAAFRAADLGLDVTMVDVRDKPGGVCLYAGCIPTKALLYLVHTINDARDVKDLGVTFGEPEIDLDEVRKWKEKVVGRLAQGLMMLTKRRGIQHLQAKARFEGPNVVHLEGSEISRLKFKNAIIATGSRPIPLPGVLFEEHPRVMSSKQALALQEIPERLLVVGGGYTGLELGSVLASLGSRVTLVEMLDELLAQADRDLAKPVVKRMDRMFDKVYTGTKVTDVQEGEDHVEVQLEGEVDEAQRRFDAVLVAIGRAPNSDDIGLDETEVQTDDRGFIKVDDEMRTNVPHISAIGDVTGGVMLAHKAMYEGKIAAEVIAGEAAAFDARVIPAVAYTDPALAWAGLTESEAREQQREIKVARFPWTASGRALTMEASAGMTKMIIDPETKRVLGVGIVGRNAGEMIAEGALAIEMGAVAEDLALTIHAHPTLSETESEVAEVFLGHPTHLLPPRERKKK
jgi:dihydrolipoamide dehydrogenase